MIRLHELVGMDEQEACSLLDAEKRTWAVVRYRSFRPDPQWDCARIVQVREQRELVELTSCEFRSRVLPPKEHWID